MTILRNSEAWLTIENHRVFREDELRRPGGPWNCLMILQDNGRLTRSDISALSGLVEAVFKAGLDRGGVPRKPP